MMSIAVYTKTLKGTEHRDLQVYIIVNEGFFLRLNAIVLYLCIPQVFVYTHYLKYNTPEVYLCVSLIMPSCKFKRRIAQLNRLVCQTVYFSLDG